MQLRNSEIGEFKILNRLGDGAFGEVYEGHRTEDGKRVVLKFTQNHRMNTNEFKVMKKVQLTAKNGEFAEPLLTGRALIYDFELTQTS